LNIREFLHEKGPSLSSAIKNELLMEGVSAENARQQISRARGGIYRLNEIQFPKREHFICLKEQYQNESFYANLIRAFNTTSSVHKCIISGLNNFGGCVPIDKLKILSGCPEARKNKKTFDQVTRELQKIGVIKISDERCFLYEDAILRDKTYMESRTIIYLNEYLREILARWLKNNNFVSYNTVQFNADFCSYYWDIKAPSYLLPFATRKADKKKRMGFVVADIIPQYDINDDDIDYFIRKVEGCLWGKKTIPFIPILLGYRFTESAWSILKSKNIMAVTVNNFFGEEIEKLLQNIVKLLEIKNIEKLDALGDVGNILNAVSKIEGPTNNLRGVFFELMVGHIASKKYSGTINLNKKIKGDDNSAEIDVLVETSNDIIVYECKGKRKSQLVNQNEIEKWKKKIAFIYSYFKNKPENSNRGIVFKFWTTSDFHDDAKHEFDRIKVRKYTVEKKNGKEVFACAKNLNLEEICSILKQYF